MASVEAVQAFNLKADSYDGWFDSPEGRMLFRMELAAVRLLMKDLVPPFLEIGVGSGRFAKALGIRYGVEPSEALLKMAQTRGVNVEQAFGEKLPYGVSIFGGVFILFTLCFADDPQNVLSEAARVLKKNGGLIIGIINRESPWGELYMQKKNDGHPIYRYARFFSPADIADMLLNAGIKVEGYSSALCQPPSANFQKEEAHEGLIEDAGFVCILASKSTSGDWT